jgi:hypothetical protein
VIGRHYEGLRKPGGLELNWTHQFLVCTVGLNFLTGNMNAIRRNTDAVVDASEGVELDVNQGPVKCMMIFRHQNVKQSRDVTGSNVPARICCYYVAKYLSIPCLESKRLEG